MKLMSFKEWVKANPGIRPDDDCCPVCNGTGEIECECDCGDVHMRECGECDGDGSLAPGKPLTEAVLHALYEAQVNVDRKKLEAAGIPVEL